MSLLAAVPVKDLVNAKQRLIPFLSARERHELAGAMLEDVLAALISALPGSIAVVTADADVMALARRHGADCLVERANRGHTEAVAFAQHVARTRRLDGFLTIPGDAPCVTAEEVSSLVAALANQTGAAFVPSLSGFGTNAALLVPPDCMPLKFGEPSFDNHLEAARERGLSPVVLRLPGIGLDIDSPEDLRLLLAGGTPTRSAALLRAWDIPARLVRRS
jgi:2-phospho-L-lactate/phosphoenolpyruvate guanylyltransferase